MSVAGPFVCGVASGVWRCCVRLMVWNFPALRVATCDATPPGFSGTASIPSSNVPLHLACLAHLLSFILRHSCDRLACADFLPPIFPLFTFLSPCLSLHFFTVTAMSTGMTSWTSAGSTTCPSASGTGCARGASTVRCAVLCAVCRVPCVAVLQVVRALRVLSGVCVCAARPGLRQTPLPGNRVCCHHRQPAFLSLTSPA